ncbi:MAG: OmpP1/FadL family transporter [Nitrospirales bacterium]
MGKLLTFPSRFMFSVVFSMLSLMSFTSEGYGSAYRILDQSASATGQGTAFAAQADDASALYFNPAGMTQLRGVQMSIGTLLIGASTTFNGANGTKTEGNFGGTISTPLPSQFYLTANLEDLGSKIFQDWTVGLGVISPFGISVEYPDSSSLTFLTKRVSLPLIDIKPTVALKVNDYLAIGGGLDIYTFASFLGEGQAEFQQTAAPGNAFGLPAGTALEANGTDTALGFNASVLWTPLRNDAGLPLVNLAFVYRSGVDLKLEGQFLANGALVADAQTTIELPHIFTWALAVWPIRDQYREWKVEVDIDYEDWSEFENLNLNLSNGATVPFARNYGDAIVAMIGTEYKWLHPAVLPDWEVAARAGYVYSESPVPSSSFEPTVPDSAYSAPSVGLGLLCEKGGMFLGVIPCERFGVKSIGLDLAYQALLFQTRSINNNVNPTLVNGKWDTILHVGHLTVRVNF